MKCHFGYTREVMRQWGYLRHWKAARLASALRSLPDPMRMPGPIPLSWVDAWEGLP